MDITNLMPLLLNLLGGGNNIQQNFNQQKNNIPDEVLASYPRAPFSQSKDSPITTQSFQNTAEKSYFPQNLLLSLLKGNLGANPTNNTNSSQPLDMLKSLMPLIHNKTAQKNSPPKFSELKSVDDYIFD